MSNLLTVDTAFPNSQHLSPNSSQRSMASPRSRPRLSFDESSLIKQQEEKRKQEVISVPLAAPVTFQNQNGSSESLRRSSSPGTLSGRPDGGESVRPSISNSSHPSLQEDVCSEIVRLDGVSGSDQVSTGLVSKDRMELPNKFARLVSLFQVTYSLNFTSIQWNLL